MLAVIKELEVKGRMSREGQHLCPFPHYRFLPDLGRVTVLMVACDGGW